VVFLWGVLFGFGGICGCVDFCEPWGVFLLGDSSPLADVARCGRIIHIHFMWICFCFLVQVGCVQLFGWLVLLVVRDLRCGSVRCFC